MARRAKDVDDLLAQIYANPADLDVRAVYADRLTELDDERGEFITIQLAHLAGRVTAESRARERELLGYHAKDWMGAMTRVFSALKPRFEAGFFVGGVVHVLGEEQLAKVTSEPAWSLITTLAEAETWDARLFAKPALRQIRRVFCDTEAAAMELLGGATKLPFDAFGFGGGGSKRLLDTCDKILPALRTLEIDRFDAKLLAKAKLLDRIERLQLRMHDRDVADDLSGLLPALAKRKGVKTVEIRFDHNFGRGDTDGGSVITLHRDTTPGPFHDVSGHHLGWGSQDELASVCWRTINRVPRATVRRLDLGFARPPKLRKKDIVELAAAVDEMTTATSITVPWSVAPKAVVPPKPKKPARKKS